MGDFNIELDPWSEKSACVAPSSDTSSATASASTRERPRGNTVLMLLLALPGNWSQVLSPIHCFSLFGSWAQFQDVLEDSLPVCRDWYMLPQSPTSLVLPLSLTLLMFSLRLRYRHILFCCFVVALTS